MKSSKKFNFKVSNSILSAKRPAKKDDPILQVFPFAKGQPLWAYKAMYDYINLRKTFDIIKFFNEGGALAYKDNLDQKDLVHHSSHEEKVSFMEIQDLHI